MRIRLLGALSALLLLPALVSAQEHEHGDNNHAKMEHPVTVVVIVRHAEKAAAPANDPPLTETGKARAEALVAALAGAKVGAVLHTPTTRTRDTAMPVARANNITPEVLPLGGGVAAHAEQVAQAVMKHPGKTVVVVGHSNTVMRYIEALGGPKNADLCDHQYNGIYTLVIAHGETRLVAGQYGPDNPAPTQACPGMAAPARQ
ncbi:MAG: histidine phosphatase family protein [Gemmatimonadaceae bacterium]|nr:histidine phosphatase family protein [Gemmatimonadaceae bacterium]